MAAIPDRAALDALVDAADRRHHRRRRRTAWIYDMVDRIFFAALLALAVSVFAKFATFVLPVYIR